MGRPRADANDTATPERLIEAATIEFAENGYAAARLEDIAARAGIRRPSLLYHFDTKEALYTAVVQRIFTQLAQALFGALSQRGSLGDRLARSAQRASQYFRDNPAVTRLIVRELLDRRGPVEQQFTIAVMVLDQVEREVRSQGLGSLPADFPVRAALMHICSDMTVRALAGSLGERLWGKTDHSGYLARAIFLQEPRAGRRRPAVRGSGSRK